MPKNRYPDRPNPEHVEILKNGVDAWNRWRAQNHTVKPELTRAPLGSINLSGANLSYANLTAAKLIGANLTAANLGFATLRYAFLSNANLREADLIGANLCGAFLDEAEFYRARFDMTGLGNVDLRKAKGIEAVLHTGSSALGIDTIYLSRGGIPEIFLWGTGTPDHFIDHFIKLHSWQALDTD